jgi:hypothetical protein
VVRASLALGSPEPELGAGRLIPVMPWPGTGKLAADGRLEAGPPGRLLPLPLSGKLVLLVAAAELIEDGCAFSLLSWRIDTAAS